MAASPPSTDPTAPAPPPPPPVRPADESIRSLLVISRSLAILLAVIAGILFLVFLVLGVVEAILGAVPTDFVLMVYALAAAAVNYLLWREIPRFEGLAAQHQYAQLRRQMVLWTALGLLFFLVDGVLLLLVWVKVDQLVPVPSGAVPPPAAAVANPTACPRCGAPATWLAEYRRYYCYHCSAYL
jgi:hypothetical protein